MLVCTWFFCWRRLEVDIDMEKEKATGGGSASTCIAFP